jgi:hypothetical protein
VWLPHQQQLSGQPQNCKPVLLDWWTPSRTLDLGGESIRTLLQMVMLKLRL